MTKAPNLRDAAPRTHRKDCRHAEFLTDRVGDVRKCEHGKIQVVDQPVRHSPGQLVWEDLHPLWNRKAYRLAKQLLGQRPHRPFLHDPAHLPTEAGAPVITARLQAPSKGQRKYPPGTVSTHRQGTAIWDLPHHGQRASSTTSPEAINRLAANYGANE